MWTGKILINSPLTQKYYKNTAPFWNLHRSTFLNHIKDKPLPLSLNIQLVRDSNRKFDYINPAQTIQDAMVKHKWIPDDNATILIPIFHPFIVNKINPGVFLWVS
jgi:hypothetical protein